MIKFLFDMTLVFMVFVNATVVHYFAQYFTNNQHDLFWLWCLLIVIGLIGMAAFKAAGRYYFNHE